MKVFITGVSGFVGTGLVEHMSAKQGYVLYGQTRDIKATALKYGNSKVDLVDKASAELFNELGIDCVIHLAGIAHDLSGKFGASDYERVNYLNTKSLFTEFTKSNASKFIFLSSIKACVDTSVSPAIEEQPATPTSAYGISKQKAERFILDHPTIPSKSAYILRPCMIYGPGNKGNLNSLYKYVKRGMPYVFGSYANKRSFLSAHNLNFVIEEFMINSFPAGIYHVADEEPISTNELVEIASRSLDRRPKIWKIPRVPINIIARIGNVFGLPIGRMKSKLTEDLVVSTSKLQQTIGKPLPVKVREGLFVTLRSFGE